MHKKDYLASVTMEKLDPLFNLFERYLDEREYEDKEEYKKAILKRFPEANKATVRPFGFSVPCDDGTVFVAVRRQGNHLVRKLMYTKDR